MLDEVVGGEAEHGPDGRRPAEHVSTRVLERAQANVVVLELLLRPLLHGEQRIDLALKAADGKEQLVVVGGGHNVT